MKKTPSLGRGRESVWDLLLDGLCCWLMSIGVILAFDQLFRFHASPVAMALHPLLVIGVLMLFHRRMWLLPLILGVLAGLAVAFLAAADLLSPAWDYITGLVRWWATLFPRRSPFNTEENILLVQWIIHIGISAVLYMVVRLTHSAALIASAAGLLFVVIMLNGFHRNILPMAWIAAGLLPLMARNFHPRRADWFHPTALTPRRTLQAAGAVVCAALCLLSVLLLPGDTSRWKWQPAANFAADLGTLLGLDGGENERFRPITLRSLGLQPNVDRLGGDISLDDYTGVLQVRTDTPTLMKGRVYDVYTGQGWETQDADSYRMGSDLFRSEQESAFDIGKPDSDAGQTLWQMLATPTDVQVTFLQRSSTLYGFGRVESLELLDSENEPPMFNDRSELFVQSTLPSRDRYRFQGEWLDRDSAAFETYFPLLEQEAMGTADLQYSSLQYRYTQYPDALPSRVAELAYSVTAGGSTAYEKMELLERYLQQNFTYTLTPGNVPAGRDFVDYFLETGEGYCVYFASAMTVMARTLGIPARFVIGYGLGAREGDSWIAMQRNAHAWVECYFYGIGWLAFDPTAGSSYTQPAGNSTWVEPEDPGEGGPGPTEDMELVPTTTTSTQPTTTTSASSPTAPQPTSTTAPQPPSPPLSARIGLIALLAVVLAVLLVLLWLLLRAQSFRMAYRLDRVQQRFGTLAEQAAYYYRDVLRQLALLDFPLRTGETPLQYLERLRTQESFGTGPDLSPVFARIAEWRYGEVPLTPEHVAGMAAVHEELEPLVKKKLGGWKYFWTRMIRHSKNG